MATSDAVQTLLAAFFFGIVLTTVSGALVLNFGQYGRVGFKDGQRLVLTVFLVASVCWALFEFVNLVLPTITATCQAFLVFSTLSDQIARVAMEQVLLWAVGKETKEFSMTSWITHLSLQALLVIRFIIGTVLVGLTRPQFAPTCVAHSSILPVSIVTICLDGIVLGGLIVRSAYQTFRKDPSGLKLQHSRGLLLCVIGFGAWTGSSIPMILGSHSIILLFRTTIPAIGLLLLVGVLMVCSGTIIARKDEQSITPEARSPFIVPSSQTREIVGGDSNTIFPSIITSQAGVSKPSASQDKKSYFGRSATPKKHLVRNLQISQPVMQGQEGSTGAMARIPTVDLNTAAIIERERREEATTRIASRSAPAPPTITAEEGLKRSISIKRKEAPIYSREFMTSMPSPSSSQLVIPNGSSTSASLSPGHDDVRRRSPRSLTAFNQQTPNPTTGRRIKLGLPPNPRSQRIASAWAAPLPQEQTVMQIRDIVYNDPEMVHDHLNGGSTKYSNSGELLTAKSSTQLKTSGSIIHRPRPVKRNNKEERSIFPPEASPTHARSKSSSYIMTRKSTFSEYPGSPSQLPALPQPPTSAAELKRLLPNDTKSMTFDEKIQLLFPAPPGAIYVPKRRSSVPSLPKISSPFLALAKGADRSVENSGAESQRSSKRSTIASFDMQNALSEVKFDAPKDRNPEVSRFSTTTSRTTTDTLSRTPKTTSGASTTQDPVNEQYTRFGMRKSTHTDAGSSDPSSHESMTHWGSVHSAVPPFNISKAMQTARTTFIRARDKHRQEFSQKKSPLEINEMKSPEKYTTIALDTNAIILHSSDEQQRPSLLRSDQASSDEKGSTSNMRDGHFRVGDHVPTFSDRRRKLSSRKMPPPTPLLLKSMYSSVQPPIVVRNSVPSPPLESPGHARQEIEAQLKRVETSDRGSKMRQVPEPNSQNLRYSNVTIADRLRLLENLEREVGQQESQWQQLHHNLDRQSVSTTGTLSPPVASNASLSSSPSSTRGSQRSRSSTRTPPCILSRRERIRNGLAHRANSQTEESASKRSSQVSETSSRASIWRQRLAEAEAEYSGYKNGLLNAHPFNALEASRLGTKMTLALGSPTPPESVQSEEIDDEVEAEPVVEHQRSQNLENLASSTDDVPSLWQPTVIPKTSVKGMLWVPSQSRAVEHVPAFPPPSKTSYRKLRSDEVLEPLSSSSLWTKPNPPASKYAPAGLWGPKISQSKSIVTRPLTQRPPRKSKRVTMLPDILESPKPLPHRRETLGIFQFPWGETSDSAVYAPAPAVPLPSQPIHADILSRLNARSREIEPGHEEPSSSFFDDYDEEDQDLDLHAASESDDDFDETTLWEIASLLKSTNVPSKHSLLLSRDTMNIIEDYDYESDSEFAREEAEQDKPRTLLMKLPIQPLAPKSPRLPASLLWTPVPKTVAIDEPGLFTTSTKRKDFRHTALEPAAFRMRRKSRVALTPMHMVISRTLWNGPHALPAERDWITESSVRPRSPSLYSPISSSSGRTSPVSDIDASDASSIASTSTKASSLWSSLGSATAKMPSWFERKKGAKASDDKPMDSGVFNSKGSARKGSMTTLPALRESRVFDSNELYAPQVDSEEDVTVKYDSSVRHPVFFTENLTSDALEVHPAVNVSFVQTNSLSRETRNGELWVPSGQLNGAQYATLSLLWSKGSPLKSKTTDATFTGHQILRRTRTKTSSVQPALVSVTLFELQERSPTTKNWILSTSQRVLSTAKLWTPPSTPTASHSATLLWSKPLSTKSRDSHTTVHGSQIIRRARIQPSTNLATLESAELFKPQPKNVASKNWLAATSRRQPSAKMWSSIQVKSVDFGSSFLWSKTLTTKWNAGDENFNGHKLTKRRRIQQSVDTNPVLSERLFEPVSKPTEPRHWLIATSRPHPTEPKLWSLGLVTVEQQDNGSPMWSKRPQPAGDKYFAGHPAKKQRRTPRTCRTQQLAPLTSAELFEPAANPQSPPRHWLTETCKTSTSYESRSPAEMWTATSPSVSQEASLPSLWSKGLQSKADTNAFHFAGNEVSYRRVRRQDSLDLPVLTSSELFQRSLEPPVPKDWLATTSKLAIAQRQISPSRPQRQRSFLADFYLGQLDPQ